MESSTEQRRPSPVVPGDEVRPQAGSGALVVVRHDRERTEIAELLRRKIGHAREARCADEALGCLRSEDFGLIVADQELPDRSGIELLSELKRLRPSMSRVLVADAADSRLALDAINRCGVSYFMPRPWDAASLDHLITAAQSAPSSESSNLSLPGVQTATAFEEETGIIGHSRPMLELMDIVSRIGNSDCAVLITGETGTGKELIGRAIHAASDRRKGVFAAVNSAAFPETLLESELFGHRRGSFTGATQNGKGLFAHADGGTVFLDEVAEMPLSMQAKLLRFLQTGEIRPVGAETPRVVNVRIVSATNKHLEDEVTAGRFREDLFYRLAVIPVEVPPLRDRLEDVPLLAKHFLDRIATRSGHPGCSLDDSALDVLMSHDWPGNVRELENTIERSFALTRGSCIRADDLPRLDRSTRSTVRSVAEAGAASIESLPMLERRHIIETLDRVGWNRRRAAEILQISTTTLWRRLKEFGIDGRNPQERNSLSH